MTNIIQAIAPSITPTHTLTESTHFILSKEEFLTFQEAFKEKARNKKAAAIDIILYNIMRGRDKTRGFTPITNLKKLAGDDINASAAGWKHYENYAKHLRWVLQKIVDNQSPGPFATYYNLTAGQCANIIEVLK